LGVRWEMGLMEAGEMMGTLGRKKRGRLVICGIGRASSVGDGLCAATHGWRMVGCGSWVGRQKAGFIITAFKSI
jgi:hypothetical protein